MHTPNTQRGFTLIELLVVISIIGMLASVVLVALQGARDKGTIAAALEFATTNYHSLGADEFVSYNFNESSGSAIDSSINNFTASLNPGSGCPGTPTAGTCRSTDTPESGGNSLYVNGTQYVFNSDLKQTKSLASETVSFWIKPNSYGGPNVFKSIIAVLDASSNRIIYADLRTGGLLVQMGGCDNRNDLIGNIQLGKWQQVTYSYNGMDISVYINGQFVRKPNLNATCSTAVPQSIYVGYFSGGGPFDGLIDDVAIYNQALTDAQIKQIYAMSAPEHGLAVAQ